MDSSLLYQKTNFDITFDFYFTYFKRKGLFKIIPELEDDLMRQYCIVNNEPDIDEIDLYQEFRQIINGKDGDSYEISWLISKIEKYFSGINTAASNINLRLLDISLNEIDFNKLSELEKIETNDFKPIFIFDYLPSGYRYVIDGTHRVYLAKQRGDKHIKGYWLSQESIFEFMNNRSINLYTFHHNLAILYLFCKSPISDWTIKTSNKLRWGTYYSTNPNLKIKLSFNDKLRTLISI